MADELELDLDTQDNEEIISRKDKRIKSLSEKYETSEKEKAEIAKAKEEAEAKANAFQKDAEFYKGFSQVATKYPGASEYQDKIREKVALGLDVEEGTMLVMAKEGKLQNSPAPTPEREMAAGGSAANAIAGNGEKTPAEMTQAERKAAILEAQAKGEFHL